MIKNSFTEDEFKLFIGRVFAPDDGVSRKIAVEAARELGGSEEAIERALKSTDETRRRSRRFPRWSAGLFKGGMSVGVIPREHAVATARELGGEASEIAAALEEVDRKPAARAAASPLQGDAFFGAVHGFAFKAAHAFMLIKVLPAMLMAVPVPEIAFEGKLEQELLALPPGELLPALCGTAIRMFVSVGAIWGWVVLATAVASLVRALMPKIFRGRLRRATKEEG
jgi:hypothetical protein